MASPHRWVKFKQRCDKWWKFLLERYADVLCCAATCSITMAIYIYGMTYVVPVLSAHQSFPLKWFMLILPTWILFGILGNLYYIRKRNSYALKLLPVPFQPADQSNSENANGHSSYAMAAMDLPVHQQRLVQIAPALDHITWHSCKICKIKVPLWTVHCRRCKTCILRRDRHFPVAMTCIGEENQANFLGFLVYTAFGSCYAFLLGALYTKQVDGTPIWLTFVKSCFSWYPLFFEFGLHSVLCSIMFGMGLSMFVIFGNYAYLDISGKKNDSTTNISRKSGLSRYRYGQLKSYLGPSPLLRILIPFFPPRKISYDFEYKNSLGTGHHD